MSDYDFLVIGGGSAGATAAIYAANIAGAKVLLIEKELLGGTCCNIGCIPTKSYLHVADLIRKAKQESIYDLNKHPHQANYQFVKNRKDNLVNSIRKSGERALSRAGVEIKKGKAILRSSNSVSVNGETITSKYILIASGSYPSIPPTEGLSKTPFLTSTSALELDFLPKSIIIIGASYIGLEFATFFNTLGAKTTVLEALDRIAPNEDLEISELLWEHLLNQGIEVETDVKISQVSGDDKQVFLEGKQKGKSKNFSAEMILIATGRSPALDLNLEAAGVKYGKKGIEVNEYLQTTVPNIYAAGDVLPTLQLEHAAVYEGWLIANNIFSPTKQKANYQVVPRVMFSYPEVASVGETEDQAAKRKEVFSAFYSYSGIPAAQINEEEEGLIKLVANSDEKLLGAHIIGRDAGNLIHLASLAMEFNLPVSKLAESISAYPTLAQGFSYAADRLAQEISIHKFKAA